MASQHYFSMRPRSYSLGTMSYDQTSMNAVSRFGNALMVPSYTTSKGRQYRIYTVLFKVQSWRKVRKLGQFFSWDCHLE